MKQRKECKRKRNRKKIQKKHCNHIKKLHTSHTDQSALHVCVVNLFMGSHLKIHNIFVGLLVLLFSTKARVPKFYDVVMVFSFSSSYFILLMK